MERKRGANLRADGKRVVCSLEIEQLKRMHFGRKSEKIDRKIEQLETRLDDLIAEDGVSKQEVPAAAAPACVRAARQPLPEHLLRIR
ncbi:Transposase C of IS166 homeodomain protein [compost metagenome]